jgi:hypothetical protein
LIIIEKLLFFKKVGNKLIKKNINEMFKILEKENFEVRGKALEIIISVIEKDEIPKLFNIL